MISKLHDMGIIFSLCESEFLCWFCIFNVGLADTDIGEKTCRGGRTGTNKQTNNTYTHIHHAREAKRDSPTGGMAGSWPHYADDAKTFSEWGVDMVKVSVDGTFCLERLTNIS